MYFKKKIEDFNLSVFKMITGINESKTITKHMSCQCKCKFDGRKCKSSQWSNNNYKCQCECKKILVCEKEYVWNPSTYICEERKYLASIMDDSAIICDEVIKSYNEGIKAIPTNFDEKYKTLKHKVSVFYLTFY